MQLKQQAGKIAKEHVHAVFWWESNPDEDPRVHAVIARILAYYPLLDSSLRTTDLLTDLFKRLISLPCTPGTSSLRNPFLSSRVSRLFSSKEKARKQQEVLLPHTIIALAVLHQGPDFFVQHNILNKVLVCPKFSRRLTKWWFRLLGQADVVRFAAAAGSVFIRKDIIPKRLFSNKECSSHDLITLSSFRSVAIRNHLSWQAKQISWRPLLFVAFMRQRGMLTGK